MAHLNAYSEGNHCLSRNHGDRRCMFLFKLSQCALFQLEFVSAAYYLWQHMHCKIITRSSHCISHSFTCLRKHKVNDSVCANFQEKRCFSKCTILLINPWAHSECMYIPFLIFTAYITISVKCKLTWVAPRVTLVAYRPGFFHLDHPTSCAFRLRKGNRGKHAKILLFACFLQENIKSSPDKEYMYITVQKSSDTLHFFIFC